MNKLGGRANKALEADVTLANNAKTRYAAQLVRYAAKPSLIMVILIAAPSLMMSGEKSYAGAADPGPAETGHSQALDIAHSCIPFDSAWQRFSKAKHSVWGPLSPANTYRVTYNLEDQISNDELILEVNLETRKCKQVQSSSAKFLEKDPLKFVSNFYLLKRPVQPTEFREIEQWVTPDLFSKLLKAQPLNFDPFTGSHKPIELIKFEPVNAKMPVVRVWVKSTGDAPTRFDLYLHKRATHHAISNIRFEGRDVWYLSEFLEEVISGNPLSGAAIQAEGIFITSPSHGPASNLIDSSKKKKMNRDMTVKQAVEMLGPGYVAKSSGTGGVRWYFKDGTSIGYSLWTDVQNVPEWNGL